MRSEPITVRMGILSQLECPPGDLCSTAAALYKKGTTELTKTLQTVTDLMLAGF